MAQEHIEIRGARENNLKNVSLRIPKRRITIFTGVSGSGKSSIVFDTLAAEAQRQLYENFSVFVRNFLPRYPQPEADAIEHLSMAVVVDQKRLGGGSHSTVGTVTDISSILRRLFWRVGEPSVPSVNLLSFNDPQGMCAECHGLGRKLGADLDKMLDRSRSLNEGAILFPEYAVDSWGWSLLVSTGLFDPDKKLAKYTEKEMDLLLHCPPTKVKTKVGAKDMNMTFEGIVDRFASKYIKRDLKTMSERTQAMVEPFMTMGPCPSCHGARLSQAALACMIDGRNIADLSRMEAAELIGVLESLGARDPVARPLVDALVGRLRHLCDIGLEYLSLDRPTDTLSGGESQRVKVVKHLTSSLTDVMYVFDEPSVGLHPRDVHRMNELMRKLRDKGNTVLVVEHDPDVIQAADHVVDVGPRAGRDGGRVVFEGTYPELLRADTLTGRHLKQPARLKPTVRKAKGKLPIRHARAHNLQDVSLDIPAGVLTVVTGVAGSGKSSLVHEAFVKQHPEAIVIDQSAVGVSSRSNPATYTGILDDVRKAFAAANKVNASLFSFNSKGACEACEGLGEIHTDLAFLGDVKTPCEACGGKRFKDEVLAYKLQGRSISDVLDMSVDQALAFFEIKEVRKRLQAMSDVGLGYLSLGQPLSTLSGGECQRIKLASELHKEGSIYVMDEPTTGLHMSDVGHLLGVMDRLVDAGNTVVAIEHDLQVIQHADWIVDMGPEGGSKGGRVVFEGPPRALLDAKGSHTAEHLRRALGA